MKHTVAGQRDLITRPEDLRTHWNLEAVSAAGQQEFDGGRNGPASLHTSRDPTSAQSSDEDFNLQDNIDFHRTSGINITGTVKEFKDLLEKFGMSQRFAAKHILDQSSQGNLSFLLEKGQSKNWVELSPRGRVPYLKMRQWLDSKAQQADTIDILKATKVYNKSGPKGGCGRREKFSMFQLTVLCRLFQENPNPSIGTRLNIADKLGLSPDRISVWFQNQRSRGFPARKMLEQPMSTMTYHSGHNAFHQTHVYTGGKPHEELVGDIHSVSIGAAIGDGFSRARPEGIRGHVVRALITEASDTKSIHNSVMSRYTSCTTRQHHSCLDERVADDSHTHITHQCSPVTQEPLNLADMDLSQFETGDKGIQQH